MLKRPVFLFVFLMLFCQASLKAQKLSIDSLFTVIHNAPTFELKYEAAIVADYQVYTYNRDQVRLDSMNAILSKLLQVARKNNDTSHIADLLYRKGVLYYTNSKNDSSIYFLNESLRLYILLKDQSNIASCYQRLYLSNLNLNHFHTAVDYIFKGIEISTQLHDTVALNGAYYQLARMYFDRKREPQKAIEYFQKSTNFYEYSWEIRNCYIAELYLQLQKPDSALYLLEQAKPILKSTAPFQPPYYFRALATYYQYTGMLDSASFYLLKAIDGLQQVHQEHNSARCYYQLGEIAFKQNNLILAENYFLMAELLAIRHSRYFLLPDIYFSLSVLYGKIHAPEKAYSMFTNYKIVMDSLKKTEATDFLISTDLRYQFSVKEEQMRQEKLKKEFEMQALVKQKKQTRIYTIGGIAAILFFGVYGFYDLRKRKKNESLQALANERLRISRDLHDDLGASLSSISVFSSAIKQKLHNKETQEAEKLLDRMSTDAQDMVTGMSEMVWTISPHHDTIENLTDRLHVYAAGILTAKHILFHVQCDEDLKNKKLPMILRKNIFLIFKESINNAAKYSDASEVNLIILKKGNRFIAEITDNGKGFITAVQSDKNEINGNGLINMRQRASEIESQLEISSAPNKGTSVRLECLLPKIGEN